MLNLGRSRYSRQRLLHPVDVSTLFRFGQSSNPYPHHYSAAFASSTILFPLHPQHSLRIACRPSFQMGWAMNRGFLVPCNAERVQLRRDWSFRAGLSLGGSPVTYSQPAQEYPTTYLLVKANSSFGLSAVTKVLMTVHGTLPMRHSLIPSTALLLAVSVGSLARARCHRSGGTFSQGFPPRHY